MKDPLERTKVVLRHLPPAISQLALMDQIDARFAGRYMWVSFRPGKASHKNTRFSQAYINFNRPEDVVEFAEYFDGHTFVNEKGAQFKAIVEYAPSQRVPKSWPKKDGREGTIFKDPEYLEFLERLAKPAENLPSAEIQLERREAERAGGAKEAVIVTPLMDFVRQKRASKSSSQRASVNGKPSRRVSGASVHCSTPSKRGSEKRRASASMYVIRDGTKATSGKDKSAYILMPRREGQQLPERIGSTSLASGTGVTEDENANGLSGTSSITSGSVESGKRIMLLKAKEQDTSHVSGGLTQQQNATSSRNSTGLSSSKHSQRHDGSGKVIRSILSSKEGRQSQSYISASMSEQAPNSEDRRPPRPPNNRLISKNSNFTTSHAFAVDNDGKRLSEDRVAGGDLHNSVFTSEKHDKRMKNKDRPDRGVWRRSDVSHGSDGMSVSSELLADSLEGISISQQATVVRVGDGDKGTQIVRGGRGGNSLSDMALGSGEMKSEPNSIRIIETKSTGTRLSPVENGSQRHVGRRGPTHGSKESDGVQNLADGKPSKRSPSGYGYHERQVWVQKSGSAS
ncbi:regulator of nonsense transcripts 3 protein [Dioscorea alata]|uniref:Regulator of nonsense transcripts 3 protein n=2 Tax=Dioscorea alata TaxID=55571 RepID=A0ACB7VAE9_DIOAL|nr:regulator of nonsense transcripts 3 protein [Dioscorea alata]KAH7670729.1 regulator of nonsense transcripts 3 protein [Dioscorea alata]